MKWIQRRGERKSSKSIKEGFVVVILLLFCIATHRGDIYGASMQEDESNHIYYSNGLIIQVETGYDNIVRLGRDSSIYITISTLESSFTGSVIINFPDASGDTVSYTKQVTVNSEDEVLVVFTIPIINLCSSYSMEILDRYNSSYFSQEFELAIDVNMKQCYVGILSDFPEKLSYIQPQNCVVEHLDLERFHSTLSDFEQFDLIVVDDFDLNSLSQEMFQLLLEWVNGGGSLILGTGEAYDKVLDPFVEQDILHVQEQTSSEKETLLGLTQGDIKDMKATFQETGEELLLEKFPLEVCDFRIEGSKLVEEEDSALVEAVAFNDGKIVVFHVMLGQEQIEKNVMSVHVNELILQALSRQRQELLEYGMYDCNVDYYRMNAVQESSDITAPSIASYIAIIIVYLLVSGPVLYFVLTKLNRQKSVWLVLPGITILFLGIVVIGGSASRSKDLKSSYFSILYYNNDQVEEYSIFNLTVPYHDQFSIRFEPGITLEAINDKQYSYSFDTLQELDSESIENYTRRIKQEAYGSRIDLQNMTSYSTKYFTSYTTYELEGSYESSIHFTEEGFEGSFYNGFECDLESAFLISNGSIISMGNIGEEKTVQLVPGEGIPLLAFDYERISSYFNVSLANVIEETESLYEKTNAVSYIVQEYLNRDRNLNLLVAFLSDETSHGVGKNLKLQSVSSGVEMLVLPIEVDTETSEGTLVYDLGQDYEVLEGGYLFGGVYRFFNGTLTLEYQLPREDTINAFVCSEYLNCPFTAEKFFGFTGSIYLYNRRTDNFDEVFQNYNDRVENLSDYLNEDHKIIVKYTQKSEYLAYYMTLPYITYYKEAK